MKINLFCLRKLLNKKQLENTASHRSCSATESFTTFPVPKRHEGKKKKKKKVPVALQQVCCLSEYSGRIRRVGIGYRRRDVCMSCLVGGA
jgi:hypothetical protein